jgi:hypothetical protein
LKAILHLITLGSVLVPHLLSANPTASEKIYLSGKGLHEEADWEFRCTKGRNCGEWRPLPVPSQWELHGFGAYNYGLDEERSKEQGQYRHSFKVPIDWQGRVVELVFEGSMTDTEVWINGLSAGPKHQGSFYRFKYDISNLLEFNGENQLLVHVDKQSANKSVNAAERQADYWIFGGIFRPVYLTSAPQESIEQLRIDARHNGDLRLTVDLRGIGSPATLEARVVDAAGSAIGGRFTAKVTAQQSRATLSTQILQPRPWSAESPTLYSLDLELTRNGSLLHREVESFGFRSIEVRPGEGLYINGVRELLRGVNRHSFWPSAGRTLNRHLNRADAELIKSLNMNAVRTAHYPPDVDFLEACDELGIYVIDELAGWHDAYDTVVGSTLVREMVHRDHNHPAVIFWSNGNEGGWNTKLDGLFGDVDEQDRLVLHPREVFSGFDTDHYPTYAELQSLLDPRYWKNRLFGLLGQQRLVMSTEMLHGLYDGGSGAGLEDYWGLLQTSPLAVGAFLWSLFDETVVRTDLQGKLDSDGNHAPDGIVGPYRERGPNFAAVKATFSPIVLRSSHPEGIFDGVLQVENRFSRTDLSNCVFQWDLAMLPRPDAANDHPRLLARGSEPGPSLGPGDRGSWIPQLNENSMKADRLRVRAYGPKGRKLMSWSFAIERQLQFSRSVVNTASSGSMDVKTDPGRIVVVVGEQKAAFDSNTGLLSEISLGGRRFPISLGPRLLPQRPIRPLVTTRSTDTGVDLSATGTNGEFWRWSFYSTGWIRLSYRYTQTDTDPYFGLGFDLDKKEIGQLRWLGRGPHPIWKNRQQGGQLGVRRTTPPRLTEGFLSGVRWLQLAADQLELTIVIENPEIDIGLFPPAFPADAMDARATLPAIDLSFLHAIPAIGTKFHEAAALGPMSLPTPGRGLYHGSIWLRLSALSK